MHLVSGDARARRHVASRYSGTDKVLVEIDCPLLLCQQSNQFGF